MFIKVRWRDTPLTLWNLTKMTTTYCIDCFVICLKLLVQWQPYLICYIKLMFVGWNVDSWVMRWIELMIEFMTPFSWQNELSISFIDFPVMWHCFSLTLTLRFCGCVKKANIDFVLFKRFDEHHLITILLLLLLFYYY